MKEENTKKSNGHKNDKIVRMLSWCGAAALLSGLAMWSVFSVPGDNVQAHGLQLLETGSYSMTLPQNEMKARPVLSQRTGNNKRAVVVQ